MNDKYIPNQVRRMSAEIDRMSNQIKQLNKNVSYLSSALLMIIEHIEERGPVVANGLETDYNDIKIKLK